MARIASMTLVAALAASPALAEGWSTEDLGNSSTQESCVSDATQMFEEFGRQSSIHSANPSTWIVTGYDLTEDDFDGIVTCRPGPDGVFRATLSVYSNGNADGGTRADIAARLKTIWEGQS